MGWLVAGPILYGGLLADKAYYPRLQELALIFTCGLIANHGLVLLLQSLSASLAVGAVLSAFGFTSFAIHSFRSFAHRNQPQPASWPVIIGLVALGLLYFNIILSTPLGGWDARSIWFFHAKMIYSNGALSEAAQWTHPSVTFSHADYPKLVPALAAQSAFIFGAWNEYIPKISLAIMIVPVGLWIFSFSERSFSFVFLLMALPLSINRWLWNGYMDGYIAIYFCLSLLLFGRYLTSQRAIDLISCFCCLFLLLNIKNEGQLAFLAGLFSIAVIVIFSSRKVWRQFRRVLFSRVWRTTFALSIWLLPFALWTLYKQQWGLNNDLEIGSSQSFAKIGSRLTDGSSLLIIRSSFEEIKFSVAILTISVVTSWCQKIHIPAAAVSALIATGVYFCGILMVYHLTPMDVQWHLNTSVERTMLVVSCGLLVSSFFIFDTLEREQSDSLLNGAA